MPRLCHGCARAAFRSAFGDLPAHVPAGDECSAVPLIAEGRHEPSAGWGAQLAVLASGESLTIAHKVCDQLVDLSSQGVSTGVSRSKGEKRMSQQLLNAVIHKLDKEAGAVSNS